jgi:hypothetical protein
VARPGWKPRFSPSGSGTQAAKQANTGAKARAPRGLLGFGLRLLVAFVPVLLFWLLASPLYNRFLTPLVEGAVRLFESPDRTSLFLRDDTLMMITRNDYGGGQGYLSEVRLADLHFNWLLWAALCLASAGATWRERWRRLAIGSLALLCFHVVLGALFVGFVAATQKGDWSAAHFGPVARNFLGLAKHLADLPLKLAMPLVLWVALFGLRPAVSSGKPGA